MSLFMHHLVFVFVKIYFDLLSCNKMQLGNKTWGLKDGTVLGFHGGL